MLISAIANSKGLVPAVVFVAEVLDQSGVNILV